jgi:hypothetical protein
MPSNLGASPSWNLQGLSRPVLYLYSSYFVRFIPYFAVTSSKFWIHGMHKVRANAYVRTHASMSAEFLCTHTGAGLTSKLCSLKDKDVI